MLAYAELIPHGELYKVHLSPSNPSPRKLVALRRRTSCFVGINFAFVNTRNNDAQALDGVDNAPARH